MLLRTWVNGEALTELIVEHTHTCYLGERGVLRDWGYGCNQCPACTLRRTGWERWATGGAATNRGAGQE